MYTCIYITLIQYSKYIQYAYNTNIYIFKKEFIHTYVCPKVQSRKYGVITMAYTPMGIVIIYSFYGDLILPHEVLVYKYEFPWQGWFQNL